MDQRTSMRCVSSVLALAGLVLALAGCGGSPDPKSAATESTITTNVVSTEDTATTADTTARVECDEVSSLATQLGPTLTMTAEQAALTKSDDIRGASAAISGYATKAPEDVQADIARVSASWDEIAGLIFELGLESGGSPDASQVAATNERVRAALAEPGFSDSLAKITAWMQGEVTRCQTATETTSPASSGSTTGTTAVVGQGVDQTCDDFVELTSLAKDVDIAHGGRSVSDIENLAAAASDLASKAPAEPSGAGALLEGEPRQTLTRVADAYAGYVSLLAEKNLEPGSEAMVDPDVAARLDLSLEVGVILQWVDVRCGEDVKARLAELAND